MSYLDTLLRLLDGRQTEAIFERITEWTRAGLIRVADPKGLAEWRKKARKKQPEASFYAELEAWLRTQIVEPKQEAKPDRSLSAIAEQPTVIVLPTPQPLPPVQPSPISAEEEGMDELFMPEPEEEEAELPLPPPAPKKRAPLPPTSGSVRPSTNRAPGIDKPKANSRQGKFLYNIPDEMRTAQKERCTIRIAREDLDDDIFHEKLNARHTVQESIRIGQVMRVYLTDPSGDSFRIESPSSTEQFISGDDYTEWRFDVTPLRDGVHGLYVRVSVVEMLEGLGERARDITVLEKEISIRSASTPAVTVRDQRREVFISYAWPENSPEGHEKQQIFDQLVHTLQQAGWHVRYDKKELTYKRGIKEFMTELASAEHVIGFITDKYLRSDNCMFELLTIEAAGNFADRFFPIYYKDISIFRPIDRVRYLDIWAKKVEELAPAIQRYRQMGIPVENLETELAFYQRVLARIDSLAASLSDTNASHFEHLRATQFGELLDSLAK